MCNYTWSMIVPPSKQLHLQIYPSSFSIKFGNLIAFHYHIFSHSSIWPSLSLIFYSWIHGFTALYFNGVSNSNILPWEDTQSFCKLSIAHQNNAQFHKLIFSVCDLVFTSIFTEEHFFIFSTFLSSCHTAVAQLSLCFV